jgi:CubicO group peptidase (beta-lactamase class C family)
MGVAADLDAQLRALAAAGGFRGAVRVALWLVGQGAISLDDPVRRWIGALPASWSSMTVRQLLTHTSGLCHWDGLGVDLCSAYQRADLIDRITSSQLLFAPGACWSYSSPGFVLVADIVETATGRPYRQVATDQLLRPLGLSHTSVGDPPEGVVTARGSVTGLGVPSAELRSTNVGTGDVWSTAADLAWWPRALASREVLSSTIRDAIFTQQAHISEREDGLADVGYCYGWFSARCENLPVIFTTGTNRGSRRF